MKRLLLATTYAGLISVSTPTLSAQGTGNAPMAEAAVTSGTFQKKRYTIKGDWEIAQENGKTIIRFSENFKTKSGPDLKVFLSKSPLTSLSGQTAQASSLKISVLKSNKGAQSYELPDGITLDDYRSVLIHCEAYSVLWGGFDIPH